MDGVIVIVIAFILLGIFRPKSEEGPALEVVYPVEQIQVNPRLNPSMTHDEHAFMRIANVLGFH